MTRTEIFVAAGFVMILALGAVGQTDVRPEGGPPQPPVMMMPAPPQAPGGPGVGYQVRGDPGPGPGGPGPMSPMRMREYAEQLRLSAREAQELADRLRRQADELDLMAMQQMTRGPRPQSMGPIERELNEIRGAIGRAEQEGRWQDAAELRQRAEQLQRSLQPMPIGPRLKERQQIERQIDRLRAEAKRAKEEGRPEDSERLWKEAERMERQLQAQKGPGVQPPEPRGDERAALKGKIERLRDEARQAKEQGRPDDAVRLGQEADRLEQQLREQGQGPKPPGAQLKDDLKRSLEGIKQEIGRLWQAVNELRNRPQNGRPT